jgi:hypothetical protein
MRYSGSGHIDWPLGGDFDLSNVWFWPGSRLSRRGSMAEDSCDPEPWKAWILLSLARLIPSNASATCDAEPRQSGLPVRSLAAVTFSRVARLSLIVGAKPSDLWHKRPSGRAAAGCSHRTLLILLVFSRPERFELPTTFMCFKAKGRHKVPESKLAAGSSCYSPAVSEPPAR